MARPAAGLALVPALDQTRTVGLVTLPGAFVGVLLGGGSAAQAGAAQLLVLVGLLATEAIAVLATVELVARRRLLTVELTRRLPAEPGGGALGGCSKLAATTGGQVADLRPLLRRLRRHV